MKPDHLNRLLALTEFGDKGRDVYQYGRLMYRIGGTPLDAKEMARLAARRTAYGLAKKLPLLKKP